jgi:hypothetical protein
VVSEEYIASGFGVEEQTDQESKQAVNSILDCCFLTLFSLPP